MFSLTKTLTRTATITSLLTISNLLSIDGVQAFTITYGDSNYTDGNSGFESGSFNNSSSESVWNSIGDAGVGSTFKTVSPYDGTYQGVITNACSGTATAECIDSSGKTTSRNDDNPATSGTYNISGSEPVSASVEISTLQNFLGLSAGTLQIAREGGSIALEDPTATRTPKEGSAITQTFTTDGAFTLSFNWNYLTNDGKSDRFGDQDFAFVTIYDTSSAVGDRSITVLNDSSNSNNLASNPNGTEYLTEGTYEPYIFNQTFPAGTYTLGYGVVDVDGVDRTSTLLVDDILISEEIPFEFSPTFGLAFVASLFGLNRLRRKLQNEDNSNAVQI